LILTKMIPNHLSHIPLNISFSFILLLFLILPSCKKIEREPKVETGAVTDITTTSAKATGNIIDLGEGISDHGHCWNITSNPTVVNYKTSLGSTTKTGFFQSELQNLLPETKYYLRAYVKSGNDIIYGNEISFTTTSIVLATLTTTSVTSITSTTAVSGGNISSDGGGAITARGVCWSTSVNPTVALSTKTSDGTGTGTFTSNITGLTGNTTYHVRAYATNSAGTNYGSDLTFITPPLIVLPTVTTGITSATSSTTATSGGNVTSDGGASVTVRGVCWSTSSNPTIALSTKTSDGSGTGSFLSNMTGLTANTTYYVRAYATNNVGTAYGNQIVFSTYGVMDIEGNGYKTVVIGTQVWMAENLKTTKYNDGTNIPNINDNTEWGNLTTPGYCWYNNDANTYKNVYGALYNWYTVNTGKLCPTGWHVPTDVEWTTLTTYLGGLSVAGGKLKEVGTNHWQNPNTGATNETGFTALPGGRRYPDAFDHLGDIGNWWSATEYDASYVWNRDVIYISSEMGRGNYRKNHGFSIRCLKD
jgi:uncharacterized protein (TIGR02145 family)